MPRPARLGSSAGAPFKYVHYPVLVLTLLQFLQAISEFVAERGHIHQSLCWYGAQGARFGKLTFGNIHACALGSGAMARG